MDFDFYLWPSYNCFAFLPESGWSSGSPNFRTELLDDDPENHNLEGPEY